MKCKTDCCFKWIALLIVFSIFPFASVIGREKVTIELLPGTDHGGPNYLTSRNIEKVFTFLDEIMK
jgi:hypothetical protein